MIKIIINEYSNLLIPYNSIAYIDLKLNEINIKFKDKIPTLGEQISINLAGYDFIFSSLVHKIQHNSFVEIYITKSNITQNYYCIDIKTIEKLNKEKEKRN